MQYDASVRKRIKATQKATVIANFKQILGMKVLFLLPLILIGVLDILWSRQQLAPLLAGDLTAAMPAGNDWTWFLQLVIGAPLLFGMMTFYITLMREEQASVSLLLQPFTSLRTFGRSLRMMLLLWLRSMLWMLVPFMGLSIALFAILSANPGALNAPTTAFASRFAVIMLVYGIAYALIAVRLAFYQAGYVRLHDNEFIGCWDAQRESAQAFQGHYGDLLLFFLSFAPWYLGFAAISGLLVMPMVLFGASNLLMLSLLGVVFVVVALLFSVFISAYQTMSFLHLFEHLAPAPEQPADVMPLARSDSAAQTPYWRAPEAPQPSDEPAPPEETAQSDETESDEPH